jgi:hypothetical protein
LQPIVVKENNSHFELIDGQQRATTILLILHYLNETEFKVPKPVFEITFETRGNQESFLSVITDKEKCATDIDLFHLHNAYARIAQWFHDKEQKIPSIKGDFYSKLTNRVRVIWYCVEDGTSAIDIFTRINIGKIPLTNAELVKALFLTKTNFLDESTLKQLQIATEWDNIEKRLQDDSFWYFIYSPQNSVAYENRIEYVLDLMQNKNRNHEDYYTFNQFSREFNENKDENGKPDVDKLWNQVKSYFLTLEEWYINRELYHLIGFLIETGTDINKLREQSKNSTKTQFVLLLKTLIKKSIANIELDKLDYSVQSDKKKIRKVLLLFNIQTILSTREGDMRFPFNKFKKGKWDIEHINSQTDQTIQQKDRRLWALDLLEYFTGVKGSANESGGDSSEPEELLKEKIKTLDDENEKSICEQLNTLLSKEKIVDSEFEIVYENVTKMFEEDKVIDNDTISNLSLLDEYTNRSYGNSIFAIKRNRIIENDKRGLFVPICTKNVFLKYYSNKVKDGRYWKQTDADEYLAAIHSSLNNY